MTMRDDQTRLLHIRDHMAEAVALAEGKTRSELEADRLLNLSLVRLLEIVGQSAARVSEAKCRSKSGAGKTEVIRSPTAGLSQITRTRRPSTAN